MGYALGIGPPGRCSDRNFCPNGNAATEPYIVSHNLLLAVHATAASLYKQNYQATQGGQIGISLVAQYVEPYPNTSLDMEAAMRAMDFELGWYREPLVRGEYSESMRILENTLGNALAKQPEKVWGKGREIAENLQRKEGIKSDTEDMETTLAYLRVLAFCLAAAISVSGGVAAAGAPLFPAMFVIGDSLVDNGNNNGLRSLAKSNYPPYGIDFHGGPTGRFCNGKTIIDFLGDLLGLPLLPAFTETFGGEVDIETGVNYASAAAGILEESGLNLGDRFSLTQQVENFKSTLDQLQNQMDQEMLNQHLRKSLLVTNIGSNDYINNYLMPSIYSSSSTYTPEAFANLLINKYAGQITELYKTGLRKFLLAGIGPLGCIPNQLAKGFAPPGKCITAVNDVVQVFNRRLKTLVDQLNANYTNNAIFVYGNTYGAFTDILSNPKTCGFQVMDRGCCGIGKNKGEITCLPFSIPCSNRDEYVFWDAYHPTQAFNQIIAQKAYSGPQSACYPINVKQMAQR
ncbi:GDSL esterase/lipase At5g08460-like [Hibiscus syriacus]|nr:GDSL esterase/lipase At5g08460-like [Hibiscus syriacus]